jgi:hypothetical protein
MDKQRLDLEEGLNWNLNLDWLGTRSGAERLAAPGGMHGDGPVYPHSALAWLGRLYDCSLVLGLQVGCSPAASGLKGTARSALT